MEKRVQLYTDGGARGNPGPAGIGGVLRDPATGAVVDEFGIYLGVRTNNQAEYEAVLEGLRRAQKLGVTHLACFLDSQLVAEQLSGRYKVKNRDLGQLFVQAWNAMHAFQQISFHYIPREQNKHADRLVNRAIDEAQASAEQTKAEHHPS